MTMPLIRSKNVSSGGIPITRGCPNVIVPTLADRILRKPGDAWSWSAYTQIIASIGYDFLLTQLLVATDLGQFYTTNGTRLFKYLEQLQIATGAAQSEVVKAEAQIAESGLAYIDGIVDDVIEVQLFVTTTRDILCGPIVIPSGTRISYRTTIDGTTIIKNTGIYLSGYDKATFALTKVPYIDDLYASGGKAAYPADLPLASSISVTCSAVTTWVLGAWSTVVASLDSDYLISAGYAESGDTKSFNGAQFEVGVGASGLEVVQARYGIIALPAYHGAGHVTFRYPFIAYKGERLAIRGACLATSKIFQTGIYGVRLS